jgi:hypothetical protein
MQTPKLPRKLQPEVVDALLRLLGTSSLLTTNVLVQVGGIVCLTNKALYRLPYLPDSWWSRLVGQRRVNFGGQIVYTLLHKSALGVAGTEEGRVQNNEDPSALLQQEGGAEDAEPKGDFKQGDKSHRRIIVVLDELANGVAETGGFWFGAGGGRSCWWLNCGEQVCTGVGQDVEDRIDGEG